MKHYLLAFFLLFSIFSFSQSVDTVLFAKSDISVKQYLDKQTEVFVKIKVSGKLSQNLELQLDTNSVVKDKYEIFNYRNKLVFPAGETNDEYAILIRLDSASTASKEFKIVFSFKITSGDKDSSGKTIVVAKQQECTITVTPDFSDLSSYIASKIEEALNAGKDDDDYPIARISAHIAVVDIHVDKKTMKCAEKKCAKQNSIKRGLLNKNNKVKKTQAQKNDSTQVESKNKDKDKDNEMDKDLDKEVGDTSKIVARCDCDRSDYLVVDSIYFSVYEGLLNNIKVFGYNTRYPEIKKTFISYAPISIDRFKRDMSNRLYDTFTGCRGDYIILQDFLNVNVVADVLYVPDNNQYKIYIKHKDITERNIKENDKGGAIATSNKTNLNSRGSVISKSSKTITGNVVELKRQSKLNTFIDLKLFSDFIGLAGKANGIVQTEATSKIILNRSNISCKRNRTRTIHIFVKELRLRLGYAKFDSEFDSLTTNKIGVPKVESVKTYQNGVYVTKDSLVVDSTYRVSSVNLLRYARVNAIAMLNIYTWGLTHRLELNIGAGGFFTPNVMVNGKAKDVFSIAFIPQLRSHIRLAPNFDFEGSINYMLFRPIGNNGLQAFEKEPMGADTLTIAKAKEIEYLKYEHILVPNFEVSWFPKSNQQSRIFFRFGAALNARRLSDEAYMYTQFGYSLNIDDLLKKKD